MKFNKKKAVTFINKMIRANNSIHADLRVPKHLLIDDNGYQIIGNEKIFVRFYEPVVEDVKIFEVISEGGYISYDEQYKRICSSIIAGTIRFDTELNAPNFESLKQMIKESHLKETKYNFILNDYPCVNARYLLDIMTVFPDARFYYDPTERYPRVYVRSEFGDAILISLKL